MKKKILKPVASESSIQKAICEYLSAKRYFFWRQNTSGMFREGRWFSQPAFSKNGIPDIILIKDGYFYGLEVKKTYGGKQSKYQKEFEEGCLKAGGKYYIVTGIDDIIKIGL